ncbi:purine nucleoside permease [Kordiimonas sp. SCSIO 12610]|uniref:purine nucleoside permease n=1 Tax=Kordiimonas sp. SCSIO 12610 TaxID=2829597 RepID=UPI00210B373A|nr:purine nucleoside permease [Kordiimonas sp. SCSIO 12610]UTW54597.1 purine nucleoside permease [Kordiimonas sp. SCSIO 12610]
MKQNFIRCITAVLAIVFSFSGLVAAPENLEAKIPIKVVVVTMFERGESTGDAPAEFQHWVERFPLTEELPFPLGDRELRLNRDKGVLGIVTGIGTIKAAATIMALGLDERFDLSNAYFVIAGIAGIDPADGSIGSAVWTDWVVDGDLMHEIDAREIPKGWTTGNFPRARQKPFDGTAPKTNRTLVYRLNKGLTDWAFNLTKDEIIPDTNAMKKFRKRYKSYPKAQLPPFVLRGDQLSAMTYWHGAKMNDWANEWMPYWTEGNAEFVTSAMEDSGTLHSIEKLALLNKVDSNRVLLLRTASNYSMQYEGASAVDSLLGKGIPDDQKSAGFLPSLESAYLIGSKVVNSLVDGWSTYKDTIPNSN